MKWIWHSPFINWGLSNLLSVNSPPRTYLLFGSISAKQGLSKHLRIPVHIFRIMIEVPEYNSSKNELYLILARTCFLNLDIEISQQFICILLHSCIRFESEFSKGTNHWLDASCFLRRLHQLKFGWVSAVHLDDTDYSEIRIHHHSPNHRKLQKHREGLLFSFIDNSNSRSVLDKNYIISHDVNDSMFDCLYRRDNQTR